MSKTNAYAALCECFKEIGHLEHAMTYLSWDQMVMMPSRDQNLSPNWLVSVMQNSLRLKWKAG